MKQEGGALHTPPPLPHRRKCGYALGYPAMHEREDVSNPPWLLLWLQACVAAGVPYEGPGVQRSHTMVLVLTSPWLGQRVWSNRSMQLSVAVG